MDRLLIELNRVSYSQRYVELYSVVEKMITTTRATPIAIADESNWSTLLEEFKDDLLVEQEAKRVAGISIGKNVLQAALALIAEKREKDPAINAYMVRLGVDDDTLHKATLSVLSIKSFLVRKQKKDGDAAAGPFPTLDKQAPWFIKLEQVTPYRYFEDAKKYVALSPIK